MGKHSVDDPDAAGQLLEDATARATAQIGLNAALTCAIAHAQHLANADISDRLLALKRDVVHGLSRCCRCPLHCPPDDGLPF